MLFLFFYQFFLVLTTSAYVYAYRALARVFSLFSSPHDVSVYESLRHTSLDTDSRMHMEGVFPKERVTQFGTPGYSCEDHSELR